MKIGFRCVVVALFVVGWVFSNGVKANPSIDKVSIEDVREWFPQATKIANDIRSPGYRLVFNNKENIGAILLTSDINAIPAYSGKPIATLVGVGTDAVILGVRILAHEEPILVVGVKEENLTAFSNQYIGVNSFNKVRVNASDRVGYHGIDGISGATITAMVLNRSIMTSVKMVCDAIGWPTKNEEKSQSPQIEEALSLEQRWQARLELWHEQKFKMYGILFAISFLTIVLFFQDWLVKRPNVFVPMRYAFLTFTVVFIGYVFSAQLSIVNILAFIQTYTHGFTWDTLMMDPATFFLWSFLAFSILLWGRGVFCGWLCPFGALQELIHELARKLNFPNFEFPSAIHERLWAIKYLILIVLIGISMDSFSTAAKLAEVEPFKTSFALHFARDWSYVVYAVGLLVISAFNSKFYCKYLCALGASLSILSRFRVFDWLRRRNECGHPCQACAVKCQISAIKPTGEIIESECHYCLDCQLTYSDEYSCPPLVEKRKKREKRQERIQAVEITVK